MSNRINIAMWSGPRNLSTALMRSFGNRKDILEVLDEPFYASYLNLYINNQIHKMNNGLVEENQHSFYCNMEENIKLFKKKPLK